MSSVLRDGLYSFLYNHGMRYTGRYRRGLRDGPWRVLNSDGSNAWEVTWEAGQWHGPATTWWPNGTKQHEGLYDRGKRAGQWTFWFESGQLAARGVYAEDRKVGHGEYLDQRGTPMSYDNWAREFHEWDWGMALQCWAWSRYREPTTLGPYRPGANAAASAALARQPVQ